MSGDDDMVLSVTDERDGYCLAWCDDDGPGLYLGESDGHLDESAGEHRAAVEAASAIGNPTRGEYRRLCWDSLTSARKALAAAKAAVRAFHDGAPMPDWALKAIAEGWKPPRGWKPRRGDA